MSEQVEIRAEEIAKGCVEHKRLLVVLWSHGVETLENKSNIKAYIQMASTNEKLMTAFVAELKLRNFHNRHSLEYKEKSDERDYPTLELSSTNRESPMEVEMFFREIRQVFELVASGNYDTIEEEHLEEKQVVKKKKIATKQKSEKRKSMSIENDGACIKKKEKGESKLKKSIFDTIDLFFEFIGFKSKDDDGMTK